MTQGNPLYPLDRTVEKIRLKLFNFKTESLKEFNSIIHMINTLMIYHKNALYELEGLKPIIDQNSQKFETKFGNFTTTGKTTVYYCIYCILTS